MSKIRENFRVVAYAGDWGIFGVDALAKELRLKKSAEELLKQIKRHCDATRLTMEWDTVCGFCGYQWETDPTTHEPVCCDKAQTEFAAIKSSKKGK
jgi:rubrerythrin